jgi:hypothetical protein
VFLLGFLGIQWLVIRAAQQGAAPPAGGMTATRLSKAEVVVPRESSSRVDRTPGVHARVRYNPVDVQVVDRHQVGVTGSVHVMDRRPGRNWIWLLRIYAVGKDRRDLKLVKERHYFEQAITVPVGGLTIDPKFAEVVDLKPGEYQVQLYFYDAAPGFDPVRMKSGADVAEIAKVARTSPLKGRSEWVTVPD